MQLKLTSLGLALALMLSACGSPPRSEIVEELTPTLEEPTPSEPTSTPLPTREHFQPGQLVQYQAQTGDNLPALAARFNTTVEEIRAANPIIPDGVTTLPPGLPMEIPIFYRAFWGSSYQIVPDSHFVNGPLVSDFDTTEFVNSQPGWLKAYRGAAGQQTLTGSQMVDLVATNFSISPRFLLALLDYHSGALTEEILAPSNSAYPLGHESQFHRGVYLQLVWAANLLNNGYYQWRTGDLIEFERPNGEIFRPDPWQNAASVALQYFYAQILEDEAYSHAIGPEGFAQSYADLFGDPWPEDQPHIPGSLLQPELRLPFSPGETWSHTGGPHTGWGEGAPLAALDFAPGLETRGCVSTELWATAVTGGLVVRTAEGTVVLDTDGDGDERTGWVIFYLHLRESGRARVGQTLVAGQHIGHPSCEGGSSTGTHVHVARKYNGEWIPAAGALPFVMEGWTPVAGDAIYQGSLVRFEQTVVACTCSDAGSAIFSRAEPVNLPTPTPQDEN